ncbi:heptosyltransferase-2 [Pelomonas aquatica]|uniref:Heptosyltransferase-2 n=1 Tax=Pelomonas aquatica TaxID=431058 RepID=A0ABU1Z501_9BURK|nr:glycosyltransferase family 9 protein [Pelomonas aquatica]MDR7295687.1 heptosyltransferase-2 [Pelomonas aquatica]
MIEARPLIVRLRNFVGDTVLSLPALRLLAQHGYRLELVGKGWARGLLEAEGWPVHVRPGGLRERVEQLRELRRRFKAEDPGFDRRANMLLFPYAFSAALDARLAGLQAEGHAGDGRTWLMRRGHLRRDGRHTLVEYWELACDFLGVQAEPPADIHMKVSDAQHEQARALLAAHGVAPGRFVLICPFANGKVEFLDRSWPAFPDFVRRLHAAGRQVVIVPGPAEVAGAKQLYPDAIRLDAVQLGVYNALLQGAGVVVANDTGPAHMAAGVGARLLSVLGPTDPARWAPWGTTVTVMRRWPGWPSVDEVRSAVDQALP